MGRGKKLCGRDYLRRPWQAGEVRSDPGSGVSGPELRQKREANPLGRHPSKGTAPAPPPPPLLPAAVWGAAAPALLPPPAPAPGSSPSSPPSLPPSPAMAQILPIRFQEHFQVSGGGGDFLETPSC